MKKFLIIIYVCISMSVLGVELREDQEEKIRTWVNREYPINDVGESLNRMIYLREKESLLWFKENVTEDIPVMHKEAFLRTYGNWNPDDYGWFGFKSLYIKAITPVDID